MSSVMDLIKEKRIVPVVKIDRVEDALPLAKALIDGGLPVAEITFRTDAAEESIRVIRENYPQMLCGAGTVVNIDQAERAVAAGAAFIVSPGFNKDVVEYALRKNIPVLPGCCTPTEIMEALGHGLNIVKFFPAKQYGGLDTIKALAAPFPGIRFMPTGGINTGNLKEFLNNDVIYACGGSWMVKSELINAGEFDKIEALTREAVQLMLGFELAHVGINETDEDAADKTAGRFESIFGFTKKTGASSVFAGTAVEVMKTPGLGAKGHIGIRTNFINRAVNYLEYQGVEFDQSSAKYDDKGSLKAIYLKEEVGGFAVHLVQK